MEPCFVLKYSVWLLILLSELPLAYPWSWDRSTSCVEHDKVALLQLKSYFMSLSTSPYYTKHLSEDLSSWDSNGEGNCCLWDRVTCNTSAHRVTELSLYSVMDYNEYNVLNVSLFHHFGELISLDLSFNNITRLVGNGGYNTLNVTKLEILNFEHNALQPQEFANLVGSLTSLKELHLSFNKIFANFPGQELAHLKKLEVLDLSVNNLYGSVSGLGICNLRNLELLRLGSNELSGNIPKCLWNSTSLQNVDLSENSFSGELPPLINLPSLQFLSISDNSFKGRVSLCSLMNRSRLVLYLELSNNALQVETGDSLCSSPSNLLDLGLSRCSLSGQSNTFPKFLSNQSNLGYLDLSSNGLVGLFPQWLLQRNSYLFYLILRNNSIAGRLELPKNGSQTWLSYLDVSSNNLKGEIPKHIGRIFSLVHLNISHNSFEGYIPASVGNWTELLDLDLSNNHLVGEVPRNLFSHSTGFAPFPELTLLLLSNNYLQGEIIPIYMNLSGLEALYLDNNNFGGTIQGSLRISKQLRFFDISNNNATGELPSWIGDLEVLESMSLAGNGFHGDIPSQLCKLKSLEFLDLSKNRFTGEIPSCDRRLPLKFLHMNGNCLTGAIPEGFEMFSSLVALDLSNNNLSGGIPLWIDQLSNLVIVLLGGNQLGGELPYQLCRLLHVNIINLSNNDISGSIPTCFRNLSFGAPELATLYTSSVIFRSAMFWRDSDLVVTTVVTSVYLRQEEVDLIVKSRYSSYKGNILSIMSELDLSDNKLAGEIPPELGELGKINALNLSYNRLSGPIPRSFSKLKSIESLDLSSNNLSGPIPFELVDLTFLGTFNVSYNNLSGQVPEAAQFGTFDERNYRGNPLLCGSRLPRRCKIDVTSVPTRNTSTGEGDEGFDMEVFLWSFGVSAVIIFLAINGVLAINPYWRRAWFEFLDAKFL